MNQVIARSIQQGRALRYVRKDETFKVNKLFYIWLFAWLLQAHNRPMSSTGEQCPSSSQSPCTLYQLQTQITLACPSGKQ